VAFAEILSNHYDEMLKLRVSLGYSVGRNPQMVSEFITFCGERFPDGICITKEIIDCWLQNRVFVTNATHNYAMAKIRGFSRYLESVGIPAYVPGEDYSVRHIQYTPYVLTDDELTQLFETIDSSPPHSLSPRREYIVPVLFRMMYCCGMRPTEPASLLVEDVDLKTGEVYIRQSKGFKDRRILMSADLTRMCCEYAVRTMPQKYFLEREPNVGIYQDWIHNQFQVCLRRSGLPKRGRLRPYDLRHNFAARTMMRWVNEGRDVTALAPYLSTYMGHSDFSSTLYYIHLLPERLLKSSGIDWAKLSAIYPEVCDE